MTTEATTATAPTPPADPPVPANSLAVLTASLIAAQREFMPAIKACVNTHFGSRYVDLHGAWEACREALHNHGMTVVQTVAITEHGNVLRSTLLHTCGAQITSEYPLTPVKSDPQAMGSAVTYARRYSLMALVGLAPEDDDGEGAQDRQPPRQQQGQTRNDRGAGSKPSTQPQGRQGNGQAPRQQGAAAAKGNPSTSPTGRPTTPSTSTPSPTPSAPPAPSTSATSTPTSTGAITATAADVRGAHSRYQEHKQLLDKAQAAPPSDEVLKAKTHQLYAELKDIDEPLARALWVATRTGWPEKHATFEAITVGAQRAIEQWGDEKGGETIEYFKNEAGFPWGLKPADANVGTPEQVAKLVDFFKTIKPTAAAAAG